MSGLIAFILQSLIASGLSAAAYFWMWWLPIVVFPLVMRAGRYMRESPMSQPTKGRVVLDALLCLFVFLHLGCSVALFQIHIGHWYGWLLGWLAGVCLAALMVPRRWGREVKGRQSSP